MKGERKMESTGFVWGLIAVVVVLCLNGFLASEMSDTAQMKGYEKSRYFHICFWLGILGYLCIIALPDRKGREQKERLLAQSQDDKTSTPQSDHMSIHDDILPPL